MTAGSTSVGAGGGAGRDRTVRSRQHRPDRRPARPGRAVHGEFPGCLRTLLRPRRRGHQRRTRGPYRGVADPPGHWAMLPRGPAVARIRGLGVGAGRCPGERPVQVRGGRRPAGQHAHTVGTAGDGVDAGQRAGAPRGAARAPARAAGSQRRTRRPLEPADGHGLRDGDARGPVRAGKPHVRRGPREAQRDGRWTPRDPGGHPDERGQPRRAGGAGRAGVPAVPQVADVARRA